MSRTLIRRVAFAACLAFVIAACSKQVDTTSAEDAVVAAIKTKLPNGPKVTVDCPSALTAEKGKTFQCTATLGGKSTKVNIEIIDVKSKKAIFKVRYTQAIVSTDAYVAKALATGTGSGSKAQCGKEKVVLKNPGDVISCTVSTKGHTRTVKFRVRDTEANLDLVK